MTTSFSDYLASRGLADNPSVLAAKEDALLGLPLAALRESAHVTQAQIAAILGKTQAAISRFESRNDFLLSSLFEYAEAIGASVDIELAVADKRFNLQESRDEDESRYFSLKEKTRRASCSLLKFASAFEEKKRPARVNSAWAEFSAISYDHVVPSSLVEQFRKAANDENQPAAA